MLWGLGFIVVQPRKKIALSASVETNKPWALRAMALATKPEVTRDKRDEKNWLQ